ncbi:hypothetical protein K1W54_15920 [Micromonospora sp. CPCC 205371]|nr:hypothetical protein [Micromonospora sp. CPCC 205371]
MTDDKRIGANLAEMGAEVRRGAGQPPAAAIRLRAEHQQRAWRTATAVLAAAAVLAVAIGAISVVRDSAAPQPAPATTETPSPKPWPEQTVTDPIAATDWTKAIIMLPRHDDCPSGRVRFTSGGDSARSSGWPQAWLEITSVRYGDVTGDGRPEAILSAGCKQDEEDSGDGQGQLLVVARDGNELRALGWVGPRGSLYPEYWVEDGVVFADVHPWHDGWPYTLGAAQAYRWTGSAFAAADASRYVGLARDVPVDLTPVAGRTGCPTPVLRFGPDGRASADGTTFDLEQPQMPDGLPHLVDLEGDGERRLLVAITCGRRADGGLGTSAVVVLEHSSGGFVALDAIRPPDGSSLALWEYSRGELRIGIAPEAGGPITYLRYAWNGERFEG